MCMLLSFQRPPRLVLEGIPPKSCAAGNSRSQRAVESSAPAARVHPRPAGGLSPHRGAEE